LLEEIRGGSQGLTRTNTDDDIIQGIDICGRLSVEMEFNKKPNRYTKNYQ
jgi:hypothetical protein